jgi:tetratricopeptide (TPR) repeat protein
MTGRTVSARSWGAALRSILPAVVLVGLGVAGLGAQQLPLKTAPPPGSVLICDDQAERSGAAAGDSEGASRLVNAATQAMLLGDLAGALDFLDRALLLDPTAAEAVYLRARILERQGADDAAAAALCHYLRLAPASASAQEVRQRLDEARDAGAAQPLLDTYRRALALEQEGRLSEAEAAFTEVLSVRPAAALARYNRAIVRIALGQETAARADLVAYLELEPRAPDAAQVRQFLGRTAAGPTGAWATAAAPARPRASTAFIIGALVPGGGQYYTGRPTLGAAVTALAGGVVAAGVLHRRTTIHCRDAQAEICPEDMISSRDTERPLLLPAIGAAAGLALVAAIEAATRVNGASQPHGESSLSAVGSARLRPSGDLQYDGSALRLELVRLDF